MITVIHQHLFSMLLCTPSCLENKSRHWRRVEQVSLDASHTSLSFCRTATGRAVPTQHTQTHTHTTGQTNINIRTELLLLGPFFLTSCRFVLKETKKQKDSTILRKTTLKKGKLKKEKKHNAPNIKSKTKHNYFQTVGQEKSN